MNDVLAYELHGNCYLNISNHCELRCAFCPKFNKQWDVQSYHLRLSREPTPKQVLDAIGDPGRYNEIVFCGLGEPTSRLDVLLEIAQKLHSSSRIRVNTDGLANFIHGFDVTPLLAEFVDAISISLNAQSETVYNQHCRPRREGSYWALHNFIIAARQNIEDVTVTAIDGLMGVNVDACQLIADSYGVKFRRRIFDQVG